MKYCPQCATELVEQELAGRTRQVCPACGYVFWNNPLPVVAGIVELDGQVVMTHKREWPLDRFGLVAGFVEAGETTEEAIVREVAEETGLQASVDALVGVYTLLNRNQVFIVYHLHATGGALQVGEELESVRLVGREELPAVLEGLPPSSGSRQAVFKWLGQGE